MILLFNCEFKEQYYDFTSSLEKLNLYTKSVFPNECTYAEKLFYYRQKVFWVMKHYQIKYLVYLNLFIKTIFDNF